MSDHSDEGRFVVSGDIRLWTVVTGSGPRVLLLHGGPGLDHNFVAPLAHADPIRQRRKILSNMRMSTLVL